MDISDPQSKDFIFNIDTLEKEGSWGLFHEIGHNRQKPSWSKRDLLITYSYIYEILFVFIAFDGTTEVTVNIFTLHAMNTLCNLPVWIHTWLKNQISETQKYISHGSKFDEWKQNPGIALYIYAQLAREYGWDSYKAVFRKYEELNPELKSNQEKMDYWIITFSRQVEYNLIPLFKFWGFPISQSTIDDLSDLEIPSITDELIELALERYTIE